MRLSTLIERLTELQELDGDNEVIILGTIQPGGARVQWGDLGMCHRSDIARGKKVMTIEVHQAY